MDAGKRQRSTKEDKVEYLEMELYRTRAGEKGKDGNDLFDRVFRYREASEYLSDLSKIIGDRQKSLLTRGGLEFKKLIQSVRGAVEFNGKWNGL